MEGEDRVVVVITDVGGIVVVIVVVVVEVGVSPPIPDIGSEIGELRGKVCRGGVVEKVRRVPGFGDELQSRTKTESGAC